MAPNGRAKEGEGYSSRWTCDVCRVKAFDSFEAALEHEKTCTGPMVDLTLESSDSEIGGGGNGGDGGGGGGGGVGRGDSSSGGSGGGQGLLHDDDDRVHQPILLPPSLNMPLLLPVQSFFPNSPQEQQEPQPSGLGAHVVRFSPAGSRQGIRPRPYPYPHPYPHPRRLISLPRTPTSRTAVGVQPSPATNHRDKTPVVQTSTRTLWKCDKCHTGDYPTFEEAAEHERNCSGVSNVASPGFANSGAIANLPCAMAGGAPIDEKLPYWTCDVCASAHFSTYEQTAEHEKVCEGNPNAPVKSITTKRPLDVEDESQLTEPISMEGMNCWSCDKCLVTSFSTYEEAEAHEKNCNGITSVGEQHQLAHESVPIGRPARPVSAALLTGRDDGTDTEHVSTHTYHQKEEGKVVLLPPEKQNQRQEQHHQHQLDGTCSIDSSNQSKKKRKRSGRHESGEHLEPEECVHIGGVLDRDIHGTEYYLPPAGGVPLVSSLSVNMCSKLSRYYQLVVDNLELYQVTRKAQSGMEHFLFLRCQNCKSNPHLNTIKHLSNIKTWHMAVKQMASGHVSVCPCLDPYTKQKMEMAEKTKMDQTLVTFCDYLASLYGMENSKNGVLWGECKPIESKYICRHHDIPLK
mmetsp:Transcript_4385/g.9893  ORF Transcript_4385/g.9893 Transcript_4385/m.9893 type:complete len:629 (+) Transcript_4385:111-1997(+)